MVESRIVPYFKETSLPLKDITGDDLNAYYAYLLNSGLKGITAQKNPSMAWTQYNNDYRRHLYAS